MMRVAIPHDKDRETIRNRLRTKSHKIQDNIPGGAEVVTDWPSEDRMNLAVSAMGQQVRGHVEVLDDQVVFEMDLPPALSFIQPMVENAIRQQGQRLIASD
ncbi:polyhydroxyalkanoic acid system family protein [Pseudopontixanthobacter vadosimaris]|uniref:polyhydroxyalkanoic acid system family protein n=1 Tax=Pseudopontixanthobacter vadosimaris TaxID=2726450 RepID=UPI001F0EDDC0|nr:polyhydroxyalkanoic acid system family protein [Pseudopontixanthobacter vadosimaris]